MNGDSTLVDVAVAFHLDTVVCICSVFRIVGLLDGDAIVRQFAMQANLLANTGANICLGNNESLFVDVHDIKLRYSCLNSGQLAWGIVGSGNWRHFQIMPMAFRQNSIFIHCGLLITKFRLDCASNLQIRQPANLDALVYGISVILGSYGHLPATIPIPTRQLTELYTWWMASTVTCCWWMSSRDMHGCSYVHLRSHPLTGCLHFYGYLALQTVESYNVIKAVNLPKAQGGARIC